MKRKLAHKKPKLSKADHALCLFIYENQGLLRALLESGAISVMVVEEREERSFCE